MLIDTGSDVSVLNARLADNLKQVPLDFCNLRYPTAFPSEEGQFILDTDASNHGIEAVLSQLQGEEEKVIAYFSRVLSKSERNYCVTRRELLAVIDSVKSFHHYLYGRKFLVRTDHVSLRWLMSFRNLEGQLARWLERLQQYDFDVCYWSGKAHAFCSSKHETTGVTPAEMYLGQDLRLPLDLRGSPPSLTKEEDGEVEYISNLRNRLDLIHQFARHHLQIRFKNVKSWYDRRSRRVLFEPGQKVWFYNPQRITGRAPKLQSPWVGPWTILTSNG
ncbi:uncharacterized protein [Temnothorax nylanderi]|uniref:uncharacterized protein n=1 Tax=Temnothorax nylanderi TaxID=102681 RepID=UPI003A835D72